jgi:hypothetical protein
MCKHILSPNNGEVAILIFNYFMSPKAIILHHPPLGGTTS